MGLESLWVKEFFQFLIRSEEIVSKNSQHILGQARD